VLPAKARPFLKWAGGKRRLIEQLTPLLPVGLHSGHIDTYVEPFIGAGALFIHLAQNFPLRRFVISDVNKELYIIYRVIQRNAREIISQLTEIAEQFLPATVEKQQVMYYTIRDELNLARPQFDFTVYSPQWIERAAQLLFLNKTCYNGLFRTNKKGLFNVPFGRHKKPRIVKPDNILLISRLLRNVHILRGDFSSTLKYIDDRSFVYCDPPYRPLSTTANFTTYADRIFSDNDQKRLATFCHTIDKYIGAKFLVTNSHPANNIQEDAFMEQLFKGYSFTTVRASRPINSRAGHRGRIKELVVRNY